MENKEYSKKNDRKANRDYDDGDKMEREGSRVFKRKKPPKDLVFDFKDVETLKAFIAEGSKIVPSRMSRLNATQQRALAKAIKQARHLALLPAAPAHLD